MKLQCMLYFRAAGELLIIFSLPFPLPWTDRQMEKGTS